MEIMKLVSITTIFFLISCSAYKNDLPENKPAINKMNTEKALIVPVMEMGSTAGLDKLKFVDTFEEKLKNKILELLKKHENEIQQVNLQEISNWAKEEMKGYKIPGNFMENLTVEGYYQSEKQYGLFLKSVSLPSHNPLVKRFLYLIPVYDSQTEQLLTVFVTIQGHVEE